MLDNNDLLVKGTSGNREYHRHTIGIGDEGAPEQDGLKVRPLAKSGNLDLGQVAKQGQELFHDYTASSSSHQAERCVDGQRRAGCEGDLGEVEQIVRMVWLLNNVYDVEHRAYLMSEKKMELTPLKIRSHGASSVMQYDERVPAGAPFTWIAVNFAHCPEDADDKVIQRTTKDGGVGDCMLLLLVWSWERLPVGRPKSSQWNTWDDHGNPVRQPTWAYKWDLVSEVESEVNLLYKQYTNEMDSLTPEQVEWQPYGVGPNFGDAHTFELNPLCVQEKHLWLMRCPLICNWAVEFHLPHRVMHQFGFFQPHPPEWVDTDTQLHRLDRRRQRKIKD
ncbi:hypothetical protein D1007_24643 [Hordeum vulgare]|nr:hypothetical protein D1007_24643 [Hordeum vulgare]